MQGTEQQDNNRSRRRSDAERPHAQSQVFGVLEPDLLEHACRRRCEQLTLRYKTAPSRRRLKRRSRAAAWQRLGDRLPALRARSALIKALQHIAAPLAEQGGIGNVARKCRQGAASYSTRLPHRFARIWTLPQRSPRPLSPHHLRSPSFHPASIPLARRPHTCFTSHLPPPSARSRPSP